jgi:hypothetical protein
MVTAPLEHHVLIMEQNTVQAVGQDIILMLIFAKLIHVLVQMERVHLDRVALHINLHIVQNVILDITKVMMAHYVI